MKLDIFFRGSLILILASFFTRFLGIFFKVPLDYLLGREGLGLYNIVYPIYSFLISLSLSGVSVALSKDFSEKYYNEDKEDALKSFYASKRLLFLLGSIAFIIISIASPFIPLAFSWPKGLNLSLFVLGTTVLFVCLMSSYRGFFQSIGRMDIISYSMFLEQFFRIVTGIGLTYILHQLNFPLVVCVAASFSGASFGALLSWIFLKFTFSYELKNKFNLSKTPKFNYSELNPIMKSIFLMSLPIAIGSAVSSIMYVIDSVMLPKYLLSAYKTNSEVLKILGSYTRGLTLVNVPLVASTAISTAIIPLISASKNNQNQLDLNLNKSLSLVSFFAFPCSAGLCALGLPIISVIFSSSHGGILLQYLGLIVLFTMFSQVTISIINSLGYFKLPIISLLIGGLFKISINMIITPSSGIKGAIIASISGYFIVTCLNFIFLYFKSSYIPNFKKVFLYPGLLSIGVFFLSRYIYSYAYFLFDSKLISLLISIFISMIFYLLSSLKLDLIDKTYLNYFSKK